MRTGKKKLEPNQNDASDHFLSSKRLHTRPTFGSNGRFLLLKSSHPSHGQTRSTHFGFRRSNPFELKLYEAQMTMGQSR